MNMHSALGNTCIYALSVAECNADSGPACMREGPSDPADDSSNQTTYFRNGVFLISLLHFPIYMNGWMYVHVLIHRW